MNPYSCRIGNHISYIHHISTYNVLKQWAFLAVTLSRNAYVCIQLTFGVIKCTVVQNWEEKIGKVHYPVLCLCRGRHNAKYRQGVGSLGGVIEGDVGILPGRGRETPPTSGTRCRNAYFHRNMSCLITWFP